MDQKTRETPSKFVSNLILQAIEHVRKRKARPDIDEICRQLKRRQNWSPTETIQCVDELLDSGILIRVEYKNNFSFRDPMDLQTGHVSGHISNTTGLVCKLQAAIDGVVKMHDAETEDASDGRGDNQEKGASLEEIEAWFDTSNDPCVLRGTALKEVLKSEVQRNHLMKKKIDTTVKYIVGTRVTVEPREPPQEQASVSEFSKPDQKLELEVKSEITPALEPERENRQRPPSKRKRKLKYNNELYELPPMKKTRKVPQPLSQNQNESPVSNPSNLSNKSAEERPTVAPEYRLAAMFRRCNEEHQTEKPSRHEGQEDEMLQCCGCRMKAHPDCLSYSAQLLSKIDRETWRCVTCKKCACCSLLLRTPSPLTCSGCDLAYHKSCHRPVIRKKPKEGWLCMRCTGGEVQHAEKTTAMAEAQALEPAGCASAGCSPQPAKAAEQQRGQGREAAAAAAAAAGLGEDSQDSLPAPPGVAKPAAKVTAFPPTPRDSPSLEEQCAISCRYKFKHASVRYRYSNGMPKPLLDERYLYEFPEVEKVSRFDGQSFPDPSNWSVEEVYNFIKNIDENGTFVDGAESLRTQGIDGEALLLLSRADVLGRFSLRVGPALKLYRLILNMKTDGNAHKFVLTKS